MLKRLFLFLAVMLSLATMLHASESYREIEKLLEARKFSEAEKALKANITANPQDDSAYFYLGQIPVLTGKSDRYDEAIENLEKCVALKPTVSDYHLWLGNAYGVKAQKAGVLAAMGYVGKIKGAYEKAIELNPRSYEARYNLIQFHLQAPSIVGGSIRKAKEIATEQMKLNVVEGRVLWATIHIHEKEFAQAKDQLFGIAKFSSNAVKDNYLYLLAAVAGNDISDGRYAEAKVTCQRWVSLAPAGSAGYASLGRCLYELGEDDAAIAACEKAVSLDKKSGSRYRLGLLYQRKGDKAKAVENLETFLKLPRSDAEKTADKERLADAQKRLDELKK
ncbi:MAG: tetratricopeptide repeat protein [Rhizobacter sp.]|nr:tetratricopeptide repeat protein [Chlorobiales bacterium]